MWPWNMGRVAKEAPLKAWSCRHWGEGSVQHRGLRGHKATPSSMGPPSPHLSARQPPLKHPPPPPMPSRSHPPAEPPPPPLPRSQLPLPRGPGPSSGGTVGEEGGWRGRDWRENDQGPRAAPERSARLMLPAQRPRRTKAALRPRAASPSPDPPSGLASWRDINELACLCSPGPSLLPPPGGHCIYPRLLARLGHFRAHTLKPLPGWDRARREEDVGCCPHGPPVLPRDAAAPTAGWGCSHGPGAVPHAS